MWCSQTPRDRRRWVAVAAVAVGLLVLAWAAVVGRDWLLEPWHLRRLESPDEEVRADAARRLGELRSARAAPRLLELYTAEYISATSSVFRPNRLPAEGPYWKALLAVGNRGVSTLLDAARGDDTLRAMAAMTVVDALPALPSNTAPVLVGCMVKHPMLGAISLGKLGPAGVEAVLREPRAWRYHGVVVTEALRARPEAFPEVVEILRKETADLESLFGLADEIAGAGERLLPFLSRAAEDQDPRVALLAAGAILQAAGSSNPAVPPLEDVAVLSDGNAFFAALQALPSLPVAALARHLSHEDPGIRARTAELLGRIGPRALPALPALLPLLGEEAPQVSMAAVVALIGLGAETVRPLLEALSKMGLEEAEARARNHALTILVSLGKKYQAAEEALLEGLGDADPRVASACASALGGVGALGALGPRLDRAVAALQDAAGRPQASIRRAALQALDAIALGQEAPLGQEDTAPLPKE